MELYSAAFVFQKTNYIHQNPVEAGIVEKAEEYLYSSARDYFCAVVGVCAWHCVMVHQQFKRWETEIITFPPVSFGGALIIIGVPQKTIGRGNNTCASLLISFGRGM